MNETDFLRLFPQSLKNDEGMMTLFDAVAQKLAEIYGRSEYASIYQRIDELPEKILDALAYDFKVDWYENSFNITEKRKTIKNCVSVHRYKGTKYAVRTALSAIFSEVNVYEWFEYSGEPFHFKVEIFSDTVVSEDKKRRVLSAIIRFRNARSVLDKIEYKKKIIAGNANIMTAGIIFSSNKKITTEVSGYELD